MKNLKKFLIVFFCLIIYVYVCNISLLPSNIIIFRGETLNFKTIVGIDVRKANNSDAKIIQASTGINNNDTISSSAGSYQLNLDLFGAIPVKEINVNVIDRAKVIPCGDLIGLKMYSKGVLVVGMSEIEGIDKVNYKPYLSSGIKEGDMIVEIDKKNISSTDELIKCVNASNGKNIEIKYVRGQEEKTTNIIPVKSNTNEYKIGLWVRDATAGVGTLTFYEPSTNSFAALGHGIIDGDTGGVFNIANGELVKSRLISIKKGEKNNPGEIKGMIESNKPIGQIFKNTNLGVYGNVQNNSNIDKTGASEYEVALRSEIQVGEAEVICEVEPGKKEHYTISIEKVYTSNNYDNKSMLIRVTDPRLIEKTGGIVQGMSGSPILQNGKFVGAVTHVLVNNPTQGYAIFGDMMIKQMREVK